MWELDHKKVWAPKNWSFWTAVLEKTLESPLDSKKIKPINPKGNQPWMFIGRTNAEAEAPVHWPPDVKSWLVGKDPSAGKDWRQEEKGVTEDQMVGWHHQLNGYEFEQTLGDSKGQGSLAVPQSLGSQRVGHDLVTEHQQIPGGCVGKKGAQDSQQKHRNCKSTRASLGSPQDWGASLTGGEPCVVRREEINGRCRRLS